MKYSYDGNYMNIFFKKKNTFPQDRKSKEYKKINTIRANLLKIIDKEAFNYIKHKTMINSKYSEYYFQNIFPNMTINLKTKQIMSDNQTKKGQLLNCIKLFNADNNNLFRFIHPYLFESYHHYIKLKYKKKLILAKTASNNAKLGSDSCLLLSSNSIENDLSPYRQRQLYKLTGKIRKKSYFNYLHSLFLSLHKNIFDPIEPIKFISTQLKDYSNEYQKFKRKFSSKILKRKKTFTKENKNELFKSSSNNDVFTSQIIHLVRCKKIKNIC